jgi:hypothetical protein
MLWLDVSVEVSAVMDKLYYFDEIDEDAFIG